MPMWDARAPGLWDHPHRTAPQWVRDRPPVPSASPWARGQRWRVRLPKGTRAQVLLRERQPSLELKGWPCRGANKGLNHCAMPKTLAMILAGGAGTRLEPLTRERAKPAVPFGGRYRIIDFCLSNFANSGVLKMKVLTQYKSDSLNNHLTRAWRLSSFLGQFVDVVPAQMRTGLDWYKGSVDAIYQNLNLIDDEEPDQIFVFGADHVYRMDVSKMLEYHMKSRADCTVAAIPVPIEEGRDFGIIDVGPDGRMQGFLEKPKNPPPMPGNPKMCLASMGNYLFETETLVQEVVRDAANDQSAHDFGRSIISELYKH